MRHNRSKPFPKTYSLLLLILAFWALPGGVRAETYEVTRNTNLREGPSSSERVIRLVRPPETVEVVDPDQQNGYRHVRTNRNEDGWAWARNLRLVPEVVPPYDRSDWIHWIDADGDCQNTRDEVLIRDSTCPVTFRDQRNCKVASGCWTDPYSGQAYTDPKDLDIDHVVALGNAHLSGGWRWDKERKKAYANDLQDPKHLLAVDGPLNRAKGSKGPEQWKPPAETYWCDYARIWSAIKARWELRMSPEEREAATTMESRCP